MVDYQIKCNNCKRFLPKEKMKRETSNHVCRDQEDCKEHIRKTNEADKWILKN